MRPGRFAAAARSFFAGWVAAGGRSLAAAARRVAGLRSFAAGRWVTAGRRSPAPAAGRWVAAEIRRARPRRAAGALPFVVPRARSGHRTPPAVAATCLACCFFLAPASAQRIELPWVTIPSGSFRMGCVPGDTACLGSEQPRHDVTLSAFELMATEVTVAQFSEFAAAVGAGPPPQPDFPQAPDHPAVHLTWHAAAAFCDWAGGRLPTEAEWEYAARAGHDGRLFWWGDELTRDYANFGDVECCRGAAGGADAWVNTAPVGSFPANGFGLHDMTGNVWEWVDGWITPAYPEGPRVDPRPARTGYLRVMRGGSWLNFPGVLRLSVRLPFSADGHTSNVGARCARDARGLLVSD